MEPGAQFWKGLGRACAGAVIFSIPMLMTMELWWLGFALERANLLVLALVSVPVLWGMNYFIGFQATFCWQDDLRDTFVALAVGGGASAVLLVLIGALTLDDPAREWLGKLVLQTIPAGFGAVLARDQFAGGRARAEKENKMRRTGYGGEVFLMGAGALFFALALAPTEEMHLIAFRITAWHGLALLALSLASLHGFVYVLEFKGQHGGGKKGMVSLFLRFSVVGHALALVVSGAVLALLGQFHGLSATQALMSTVVLSFPAALGAGAARVIL